MYKIIEKYGRLKLVIITTALIVLVAYMMLVYTYATLGIELRSYEITMAVSSALVIGSILTWYLFGLIKRQIYLEKELRESISKEKKDVYLATIFGAQHITNNLLNGLLLIEKEIEKHESFDKKRIEMFKEMQKDTKELLEDLSSVEEIEAEYIKKSVVPK